MPSTRLSHARAWMLVSAAWIIPAMLGGLNSFAQQRIGNQPPNLRSVLFTGGDWLLYGALTPFVFALAHRFPLARPRLRRHAALHLAAALGFCALWAGAGTLLKLVILPDTFPNGVLRFYVSWLFTTLPFGVSVYLAVVGIEHAITYLIQVRDHETQVARMAEQLMAARLSALQSQLNPHFLFNSLNTATVLVRDGERHVATRVLEQLSGMLRKTLNRSRDNEVSLDDELELVRQYLSIEEIRYSDRLTALFDVQPEVTQALVPPFVLQHLVENAIRHGIARRTNAGRIVVSAVRNLNTLELSVSDDGPGIADHPADAPGHGLSSTRERLVALYGAAASLVVRRQPQGTMARLRIPFHVSPIGGAEDVRTHE